MRKAILYGNDLTELAYVAASVRDSEYDIQGNILGIIRNGKAYSVKFNKAGVTVWCNDDIPPQPNLTKQDGVAHDNRRS